MQTLKDDKRALILTVAHREFLKSGVKKTSIQTIATCSGIAVGNIYHYFRNKDEIYCAVMQPTIQALYEFIDIYNGERGLNIEFYTVEAYQQQMIETLLCFVRQHQPELRLLLFHSVGTSLENFRETLVARQITYGKRYLEGMKRKHPHLREVSPLCMHFLCSTWTSMLGTLCMQDDLSDDRVQLFLKEYITYGTAGWRKLIQV